MLKAIGSALKAVGGVGTVANVGFGLWFGTDSYQEAKENGSSTPMAVAKGLGDAALPMLLGGTAYLAYSAVTDGPGMAVSAIDSIDKYRRRLSREGSAEAFVNSKFNDTQQAYTMRQAGMAIAQRSQYNVQQAMMGNEAKYMMK